MMGYLTKNILFWFGLVFSAIGIFLVLMIPGQLALESLYKERGAETIGVVESKRDLSGGPKNPDYRVTYTFRPPDGTQRRREDNVDESVYESVRKGDRVAVQYIVHDPATHRLKSATSRNILAIVLAGFAFVCLLAGLPILFVAIRRALRQSRLWDHGTASTARVVEFFCCNPEAEDMGDRLYQLIYEYEVPGGETKTGKSQFHNWSWFGRVAEGDTIDIVVDPKSPGMSEWRKEME